jgi:hypothetical protein
MKALNASIWAVTACHSPSVVCAVLRDTTIGGSKG